MEVALQLADRCERGYELNTRTLNNSRSTYSDHFGQGGSVKGWRRGGGPLQGVFRSKVEFDLIGLQTVGVSSCVGVTIFDGPERSST